MDIKALLAASFLLLATSVPVSAHADGDEAKVRAIAGRWEQAWNQHDTKALAALFTEDADFVNVGGRHWKGRAEIESEHAARSKQFVDSVWSTKNVRVQFLKPDLALVHVAWGMHGDKDPDGMPRPPREGVFTWVAAKHQGQWLIRAAQNTNRGNLPPATKSAPPG